MRIPQSAITALHRLNKVNIGTGSAVGTSITVRRDGVDLDPQDVRLVWGTGRVVIDGQVVSIAANQVTIYGDTDLDLKSGDTFTADGRRVEVIRGSAPMGHAGIGRVAVAEERAG